MVGEVLPDRWLDGVFVDPLCGCGVAPAGAVRLGLCGGPVPGGGGPAGAAARAEMKFLPATGGGDAVAVALGVAAGEALVPARCRGQLGEHEFVLPANVAGGLLGFGVVAQPHERGTAAPEHVQGVLAQVPEHHGERHAAPFARTLPGGTALMDGEIQDGSGNGTAHGGSGSLIAYSVACAGQRVEAACQL